MNISRLLNGGLSRRSGDSAGNGALHNHHASEGFCPISQVG